MNRESGKMVKLRESTMREYSLAAPSNLSRESVGRIAEKLSRELSYSKSGDVRECVSLIGGKVKVKDFWETDEKTGSLIVRDIGDFVIYIPGHTSIERDNFTIAHELGHYVLHCLYQQDDVELPMVADRYGSGRVEWEANWFAASFLMPEERFKKTFHSAGGHLQSIAKHFGVSEEAARVRAKSLGLI